MVRLFTCGFALVAFASSSSSVFAQTCSNGSCRVTQSYVPVVPVRGMSWEEHLQRDHGVVSPPSGDAAKRLHDKLHGVESSFACIASSRVLSDYQPKSVVGRPRAGVFSRLRRVLSAR